MLLLYFSFIKTKADLKINILYCIRNIFHRLARFRFLNRCFLIFTVDRNLSVSKNHCDFQITGTGIPVILNTRYRPTLDITRDSGVSTNVVMCANNKGPQPYNKNNYLNTYISPNLNTNEI